MVFVLVEIEVTAGALHSAKPEEQDGDAVFRRQARTEDAHAGKSGDANKRRGRLCYPTNPTPAR